MGRRITLVMTLLVLGGFSVILLMNVAAFLGVVHSRYISPNEVRGMAVEHSGILYTLSFEQQNTIVDILNRAIPISQDNLKARKASPSYPVDIQRIVIYRFNAPDIEIHPVGYVLKTTSIVNSEKSEHFNLVFSVPEWNPHGFLEEAASDELHKLLPTTYDP